MAIKRLYVEKKPGADALSLKVRSDIKHTLNIKLDSVRIFIRYDIEGLTLAELKEATGTIFSEPPVDIVTEKLPQLNGYRIIATEYLPGQYDQRADSAAQCVQLLTMGARPLIRCATVYAVRPVTDEQFDKIKKFLINPVEAREASLDEATTLETKETEIEPVKLIGGFIHYTAEQIKAYHEEMGFAMSINDLLFVQAHFGSEMRNPSETELKVIDTYWSDHCRHTTFLTHLNSVKIKSDNPHIQKAFNEYLKNFNELYEGRTDKYPCLMDMATIGAKLLKKKGLLSNLDESEEINACSINVTCDVNGKPEEWLVMFKNETHNHPTEIEPFGGAATCLGGAIRDPLSGRVYVYQAMRVSGAGDITAPADKTIKGKLPQRVISKTAAAGFSSYGNQIGLATGGVHEVFHEGYVAKRLETGFVVGAAPKENVIRIVPKAGDVVLLIGGETGRDGCGGATGSSKAHTVESIDKCGAEVQKGNPLTERKIQRLFRNSEFTRLIKRCNDFGAGGVSVAVGELSPGLDINLDSVPKKYQGLCATELSISESQERMAIVIESTDVEKATMLAREENLDATLVATVTDTNRMRMYFGGNLIVDLPRKFLDSNGVKQTAAAVISDEKVKYFDTMEKEVEKLFNKGDYAKAAATLLTDLNVCSQKGLSEMFDSTIGAGSVLMPFGGKDQLTPSISMAAKLPVVNGVTDTATVAAYGFDPYLMSASPFVGAMYSIVTSVIKVVATGAPIESIRLTLQEFFCRLKTEPERWGLPVAAMLGALYTQLNLGLAAIGGKDSMSGSFEKIDVPPTLISFALGVGNANNFITNVLTVPNKKVYRVALKRDEYGVIDFEYFLNFVKLLYGEICRKSVDFATVIDRGGVCGSIIKSCLGSGLGFDFVNVSKNYFTPSIADVLISVDDKEVFVGYDITLVGTTTSKQNFTFNEKSEGESCQSINNASQTLLALKDASMAFTGVLENVYPTSIAAEGEIIAADSTLKCNVKAPKTKAIPSILIPVFPGTNCEYDTLKRFSLAGGKPEIYVIKNRTSEDIEASVKELSRRISSSQIIMFPGGFSGGDEPDGSGKFFATFFRNARISDAIKEMLYKRDGLALGICNGFQALIKLGLFDNKEISVMSEKSPTLTFNNISRHISQIVDIRVASCISPWLSATKPGDVFKVAVSHGEGKFIAENSDILRMIKNGQIATQYVDELKNPTMKSPFNPNGSLNAIEGITSADGKIFGKMGHSERIGSNLYKNVPGDYDMKIFESGVKYFLD